jgi:hypothetical protein
MAQLIADWPDDADGDVLRRLADHDFDFSAPHLVDYNVDFENWPPSTAAIERLESLYGRISLHPPSHDDCGYAQFQVFAPLTYESVTTVQRQASGAMAPWGGVCESWGVMQDAP